MVRIADNLKTDAETAIGIGTNDLLNDQFEIGPLLGKGGMGAVYRAQDTLLDRPVAVKVLPAFLGSSKRAREGLRKEAARAIELAHPALARAYYFGIHAEQPFLVMEYIDGETLADQLDAGALDLAASLELLRPLAEGIDYAHTLKLVHRDIKPSNILVRASNGRPVLIDFGIAGEARDQATRSGLTDQAGSTGTLSYMSPEQIRGRPPHPAMDVYALAAVAYEMLGGDPPFFRGDPLNVQYQIVNEPPPPIEEQTEATNQALIRGLAKDPKDRFQSAGELVAALAGEAVASRPAEKVDRAASTQVGDDNPPVDEKTAAGATLVDAGATAEVQTDLTPAEKGDAREPMPDPAAPLPTPAAPSVSGVTSTRSSRKKHSEFVRLLFASFAGFADGYIVAFLAFGIWGGFALPMLTADGTVFRFIAQNDGLYALATLAPLFFFATPFGLLNGLFLGQIETRFPGAAPPFLFGTTSGYFLGAYTVCFLIKEAPAQVAAAVAGFCGMFLVAGWGLFCLAPKTPDEVRPPAWWGWRLGLAVALPVSVAMTGYVVGSKQVVPPFCIFYDSFVPGVSGMAFAFGAFHYLWWGIVVIPILSVVTQFAAPVLEERFPQTGRPFSIGMSISLVMPLVVNLGLGWMTDQRYTTAQHDQILAACGYAIPKVFDLGFFQMATILISTTGPVSVMWAARDQLFSEEIPAWMYALAAANYRILSDFVLFCLVFDYCGLVPIAWEQNPFNPMLGGASLVGLFLPFALLHGLGVSGALSHLLVHGRPGTTVETRKHIVAGTHLLTPMLFFWLYRTHDVKALAFAQGWKDFGIATAILALPLVALAPWVFRESQEAPEDFDR